MPSPLWQLTHTSHASFSRLHPSIKLCGWHEAQFAKSEGQIQSKITFRIFAKTFMNSFSFGLFKEIFRLFTNTQVPRAQGCDALYLHVDSDSLPRPTYVHLRGQEGLGWGLPAHTCGLYTRQKNSCRVVLCSVHQVTLLEK